MPLHTATAPYVWDMYGSRQVPARWFGRPPWSRDWPCGTLHRFWGWLQQMVYSVVMKSIGWSAYEVVGISIPNPGSIVRVPVPPGLSREALDRLEREIDRINAESSEPLSWTGATWSC